MAPLLDVEVEIKTFQLLAHLCGKTGSVCAFPAPAKPLLDGRHLFLHRVGVYLVAAEQKQLIGFYLRFSGQCFVAVAAAVCTSILQIVAARQSPPDAEAVLVFKIRRRIAVTRHVGHGRRMADARYVDIVVLVIDRIIVGARALSHRKTEGVAIDRALGMLPQDVECLRGPV